MDGVDQDAIFDYIDEIGDKSPFDEIDNKFNEMNNKIDVNSILNQISMTPVVSQIIVDLISYNEKKDEELKKMQIQMETMKREYDEEIRLLKEAEHFNTTNKKDHDKNENDDQ